VLLTPRLATPVMIAVTAGRVLARGTVFTAAEEIERASGHAGLEGDFFLD
jgi:hypothetical protein